MGLGLTFAWAHGTRVPHSSRKSRFSRRRPRVARIHFVGVIPPEIHRKLMAKSMFI